MTENNDGKELCRRADSSLPAEKRASLLRQIGEFAVRLGQSAGALAKKLAGIKSADEAMREIDAQLGDIRARREPVSKRYEELYAAIVAKKKAYQAAPPARKKVLEMELRGALAEYQSLERQLAAYLKNETVLAKVKGRMCELVAMSLRGVSEGDIDKLADKIEDAADESVDIDGAIADLDKAGVRREAADDGSLEEALAAFGDETPADAAADQAVPNAGQPAAPDRADPLADD